MSLVDVYVIGRCWMMDGWMDGYGWMDREIDVDVIGRCLMMDGWMDGWIDGWMDMDGCGWIHVFGRC